MYLAHCFRSVCPWSRVPAALDAVVQNTWQSCVTVLLAWLRRKETKGRVRVPISPSKHPLVTYSPHCAPPPESSVVLNSTTDQEWSRQVSNKESLGSNSTSRLCHCLLGCISSWEYRTVHQNQLIHFIRLSFVKIAPSPNPYHLFGVFQSQSTKVLQSITQVILRQMTTISCLAEQCYSPRMLVRIK